MRIIFMIYLLSQGGSHEEPLHGSVCRDLRRCDARRSIACRMRREHLEPRDLNPARRRRHAEHRQALGVPRFARRAGEHRVEVRDARVRDERLLAVDHEVLEPFDALRQDAPDRLRTARTAPAARAAPDPGSARHIRPATASRSRRTCRRTVRPSA